MSEGDARDVELANLRSEVSELRALIAELAVAQAEAATALSRMADATVSQLRDIDRHGRLGPFYSTGLHQLADRASAAAKSALSVASKAGLL